MDIPRSGQAPPSGVSLLRRVAIGDAGAVRECLAYYGALVWSLARRASPSPAEAEDAVQDIFVDLWKNAGRFDPTIATEATFIAMIARRRLIDRRRQRQRQPSTESIGDRPSLAAAGLPAEVSAEASLAAHALNRLKPEQREVLVLATCQGLSHEEIALRTGIPLGTVKSHARRGLSCIRRALLGVEEESNA